MMDPQVYQIAVALAVMGSVAVAVWLMWFTSGARFMRCPETGAIDLVDVNPAQAANGETLRLGVRQCDLWPKRQGCARGCLSRYSGYSETAPWYRVRLEALRPFERESPLDPMPTARGKAIEAKHEDRQTS